MRLLELTSLSSLFEIQVIHHVACYVITDAGNLLVQKKKSNSLLSSQFIIQSFGGCNYPNHVVRMMNSLRLELMDECGLILKEDNLIRSSPLIIIPYGATLLQVFMVKDEKVNHCWSAEQARKIMGNERVPPEAGGNEVDEEVRMIGNCIHKIPLSEVKTSGKWRNCDLESFNHLESTINRLLEGEMESDELVLVENTWRSEDVWNKLLKLKLTFDSPELEEFRKMTRLPWHPILWNDASRLFEVSAESFLKLP